MSRSRKNIPSHCTPHWSRHQTRQVYAKKNRETYICMLSEIKSLRKQKCTEDYYAERQPWAWFVTRFVILALQSSNFYARFKLPLLQRFEVEQPIPWHFRGWGAEYDPQSELVIPIVNSRLVLLHDIYAGWRGVVLGRSLANNSWNIYNNETVPLMRS